MAQKKFQIRWTVNAYDDYERIYHNILSNWPVEVAEKFCYEVESRLHSLAFQPYVGRIAQKRPDIRSILIYKYNRLYYRIANDAIELLAMVDGRQNPAKNEFD